MSPDTTGDEGVLFNPASEDEAFAAVGVKTLASADPEGRIIRSGGWFPSLAGQFPSIQEFTTPTAPPAITGPHVFLWEAIYRAMGNQYPPWNWQLTGSCVNGGYNNCLKVLMGQEIVNRPEAEGYAEPFTLHTYGLSRYLGFGAVTEGEGSFGLAMGKAGDEGGVAFVTDPEVDKPHICGDAVVYDAAVELKWSNVRNCPPGLKERSKKYRVQYVRCRSRAEADTHLRLHHPLTFCGNWGGSMRAQVQGSAYPLLVMSRRERWDHQQSCLGKWENHPELGDRYFILNQWWNPGTTRVQMRGNSIWKIITPGQAVPMHGEHPVISQPDWKHPPFPRGGYWIGASDMDYQCQTGEVCAMILFDGLTGQEIGAGNI